MHCCRTRYVVMREFGKLVPICSFLKTLLGKPVQKLKTMDLTIRLCDVFLLFHKSLFFGHATGDVAANKMFETLAVDNLA